MTNEWLDFIAACRNGFVHEKDNLFYVCSPIEFIGRKTKNRRSTIVKILRKKELQRQLELAYVNHCLSFQQVSDEIIEYFNIQEGDLDSSVYYSTPQYLKYSYLDNM